MNQLRTKVEQSLGWFLLFLILAGCVLVLWPFSTALLWATILAFSTWPVYCKLLNLVRGHRTVAALLVSFGMISVLLLPFGIVGVTLSENVDQLKAATQRWIDAGPPAPPTWLAKIPLVGNTATETWKGLAADTAGLMQKARNALEPLASWLLKAGLKLGAGLLQMALSILLCFLLLRNGTQVAERLTSGVSRTGGERGLYLLGVAGNTIRGVVYGILGTALVQAVMAGIGLLIAGVPGVALLAMLTFFLSVVPFGPPFVLLPAAFWLFHQGSTGWGIFMLIWTVVVSTVDNFVKPWLISQGNAMPFILILFGVLGGAMAFGFIGVFIGPTLLAVGHRLVAEWSAANRGGHVPEATADRPTQDDKVSSNPPVGT